MLQAHDMVLSKKEIASHCTEESLWVTVNGQVYDITPFLQDHPGGADVIVESAKNSAGGDIAGIMKEYDHSSFAYDMLKKYKVGVLRKQDQSMDTLNDSVEKPDLADVVRGNFLQKRDDENFIDLNEPVISQMWGNKFDKEFYLTQVHIPRYTANPARFFTSDYLEPLSRTYWYVVPLVWVPIAAFLIYDSFNRFKLAHDTATAAIPFVLGRYFTTGVFLWTLVEYTLHRFLFHIEKYLPNHPKALAIHFLVHGVHHFLPMDRLRLVMPPALATMLAIPVFSLCLAILQSVRHAEVLFAGLVVGYVLYDLVHYYLHHGAVVTDHLRSMKKFHMEHHYRDYLRGFGITTKFWDKVFGTML